MSKITDKLYLGNYKDASNYNWLRRVGITHIVNAAIDVPIFFMGRFRYMHLNLHDNPSQKLEHVLYRSCRFIENAISKGGKILVHCHAGISRSASIVIYYLIKKYKLSYHNALHIVKNKRPIINPNIGFKNQLNQV